MRGIDWNPALELANAEYDRFADIFRLKDRTERLQRLRTRDEETRPLREQFKSSRAELVLKSAASAADRGRLLGRMLLANAPGTFLRIVDAEARARQTFDTVTVAFALKWHQTAVGQYPDSLAKLAPAYLKEVPGDVFNGKGLIYRTQPNGFLLYSVGPNGDDDGARAPDSQPPGDDIVVRIPLPAAP